jgi:phenylpropionate dioxygenase-like ring-hydroxylating dioxygenase large terminal subunit
MAAWCFHDNSGIGNGFNVMTYARNAWYVASWASELPDGKPQAISILGEPLVIYRGPGGLAALEDHGDAALRDMLKGIAEQALGEDKVMIEAQHKVIRSTPNPQIMPTAHDRGVTIFNRMVEKMARDEARA